MNNDAFRTLRLPHEINDELIITARRRGVSAAEYIRESLQEKLRQDAMRDMAITKMVLGPEYMKMSGCK